MEDITLEEFAISDKVIPEPEFKLAGKQFQIEEIEVEILTQESIELLEGSNQPPLGIPAGFSLIGEQKSEQTAQVSLILNSHPSSAQRILAAELKSTKEIKEAIMQRSLQEIQSGRILKKQYGSLELVPFQQGKQQSSMRQSNESPSEKMLQANQNNNNPNINHMNSPQISILTNRQSHTDSMVIVDQLIGAHEEKNKQESGPQVNTLLKSSNGNGLQLLQLNQQNYQSFQNFSLPPNSLYQSSLPNSYYSGTLNPLTFNANNLQNNNYNNTFYRQNSNNVRSQSKISPGLHSNNNNNSNQNNGGQHKNGNNTTSNNALANLKLIAQIRRRIMYFFKKFTASGRKQFLSKWEVRKRIDDKSDYSSSIVYSSWFKKAVAIFKNLILDQRNSEEEKEGKYLMNPDHSLRIFGLYFFTFFNSIFFLIFSILIIYHGPESNDSWMKILGIIVWILECLVQLNTRVYRNSTLVGDRYQISGRYIRERALYDWIAIILLASSPSSGAGRITCECISFVKLKNLFRDIYQMQKQLCMTFKNYYLIQLVNLCIKILMVGHIIACAWYLVGQIELNYFEYETTWYDEGFSADRLWWKLYLESLYWALTLLTTGSNTAFTVFQLFFTTFIMLFTTIIFGYLLNVTGAIISQFEVEESSKQLDLTIVNEYMRQNKIPKQLITRVNLDIENYYESSISQQEAKQLVLNKISPTLQNQLKLEYCNQILEKVSIIKDKFSSQAIEDLSLELEEVYFLPNQLICSQDQKTDICLMFVISGQVELSQASVVDAAYSKPIGRLHKGSILGALNFFTGKQYDKTARSKEFTKIVKIQRDKFLDIIGKNDKDLQVFSEIRDKLMMYENYGAIKQKCVFCTAETHLEVECHLVHIQKDEIYQKAKFFQNLIQERMKSDRRPYTSNILQLKDLQAQIMQYRQLYKPQRQGNSRKGSMKLTGINSYKRIDINGFQEKVFQLDETDEIQVNLNSEGEEEEDEDDEDYEDEEEYDDDEEGIEEEYDDEDWRGISGCEKHNFRRIKTNYSNSNEEENIKNTPKIHDYQLGVKTPSRKIPRRKSEDAEDCISNSMKSMQEVHINKINNFNYHTTMSYANHNYNSNGGNNNNNNNNNNENVSFNGQTSINNNNANNPNSPKNIKNNFFTTNSLTPFNSLLTSNHLNSNRDSLNQNQSAVVQGPIGTSGPTTASNNNNNINSNSIQNQPNNSPMIPSQIPSPKPYTHSNSHSIMSPSPNLAPSSSYTPIISPKPGDHKSSYELILEENDYNRDLLLARRKYRNLSTANKKNMSILSHQTSSNRQSLLDSQREQRDHQSSKKFISQKTINPSSINNNSNNPPTPNTLNHSGHQQNNNNNNNGYSKQGSGQNNNNNTSLKQFDNPNISKPKQLRIESTLLGPVSKLEDLGASKQSLQQPVFTPWDFDSLKDYKFYFPKGNSKLILVKFLKSQRKKAKQQANKKKLPAFISSHQKQ